MNLNSGNNTRSLLITAGLLLLICIGFRVWSWQATQLTLEDALITFRYADNIASGNGYVYNINERIQGTTTPLWTLLLAGSKYAGADLFSASRILGILFDSFTCLLLIVLLYPLNTHAAVICTTFFAVSPTIIPVTISGMETPLLLCAMSITLFGYTRKNMLFGIGLALTILTRIDGILYAVVFAGAGLFRDRKWTIFQIKILCFLCLPWYLFSFLYFDNVLPQSLLAKKAIYDFDLKTSAYPFIGTFTPFLDSSPAKIIYKSFILLSLAAGTTVLIRSKSVLYPVCIFFLLYTAVFMFSKILIFVWYLVPAVFISYILIAAAIEWYIVKVQKLFTNTLLIKNIFPIVLFLILSFNFILVREKNDYYYRLQEFEKEIRQTIGLWIKNNAKPGSKVFLEPIGYIGYYAGIELNIQDEIGLVTPAAAKYRTDGSGWYIKTIREIKPDYIVQYAAAIENNEAEGTQSALFNNNEEKLWFFSHYNIAKIVKATGIYPQISQKEKEYIIFKKNIAPL